LLIQARNLFGCANIGTVIGSAGMNTFAFAAQTTTAWLTSAAVTLGIAIRRSSAP
jgi:hypothetical protein